jgi:hypothetical protein
MQTHTLGFNDRRDALAYQLFDLIEPEQRAGKSKTVIAKLCHHQPCMATAIGTAR